MRVSLTILATSALLASITPASLAQVPIESVTQGRGVTISGTVRCIVGNDFILDDGTGEIIVDAGPLRWHRLDLQQGEQVTVLGRPGEHDFDAIQIIRSNGEVLNLRPASGRPPWAGGRRNPNFPNPNPGA
ncbi:DNA-binding protein [Phormidium yuhuli AB48]|uniref:DNA-binding protein n=1 Tax=Phormidium yuhuli AB48 TaxID=2940671 RepID=A0ABY5ANW0_9CYAN|nr:DNA-binding protein [Phormidium yuhuli]USR90900.1 DNA-binding protein [Phormidium yuhuli AB48]